MTEVLSPIVAERGEQMALADELRSLTWRELDERLDHIGGWFATAVPPDASVAIYGRNSVAWYETLLGAMVSTTVVVPVNRHFTAPEVAYVLDDAAVSLLVTDDEHVERARQAVATTGRDIEVVVVDGRDGIDVHLEGIAPLPTDKQGVGPVMFYTSGTTGQPKGVRSTALERGSSPTVVRDVGALMCAGLGLPTDGTTLLIGPAYHSAQWALSVFPLLNGAALVTTRAFDAAACLAAIERHHITHFHAVPTQFVRMLQLPPAVRERFDLSSLGLVVHGAAPCAPSVKREMIDWLGPIVTEYYGATEAGFVSTITADEWLERPTSVGRPLPIYEVVVLDDEGERVDLGGEGELWFKSLMGNDFEYHGDPDKTASSHRDDLFTVGDVGYVDPDGYVHLSDRKIDMIISGGVNIYPAEVEAALTEHSAVAAAAVVGVPNAEFGEEVAAVLELQQGSSWSNQLEQELRSWCRQRLAGYKQPRTYHVRAELPRTETGKVLKREIRSELGLREVAAP